MLFNTKEYEWSDVTVILAGRMIVGFRGVAYTSSQEKEMLYGKGNKPHSMQTGNKSYSGTVTLTQSELEALEKAAGGDALDASFNMIVSYGNPSRGDAIKTDLIKGASITEIPKEMQQGAKFMECALPFVALDIKKDYV